MSTEAPLPRIAQVVPSLRGGGLERVVYDLTRSLHQRGAQLGVFTLSGGGTYQDDLSSLGVPVVNCAESGFRVRGLPRRLLREVRRFAPDIIHAHSGTWFPSRVVSALQGSPICFTDHGRYPPETRGRALVERWCAAGTSRIVVVSAHLATYLEGFLKLSRKPEVIPNGIDLARFRLFDPGVRSRLRAEWGFADQDLVVVAVGRFAPVKNHVGMIRALSANRNAGSPVRLLLLGEGELEPAIREEAAQREVGGSVVFGGFRSDVPQCLSAADIWLSASLTEGLPLSVLEAMAAGLPIVSTAVGGIPEALGDPPCGVVVPPGDDEALAAALAGLAAGPAVRLELGKRARERSRSFDLDSMTDAYARMYRAVLAERTQ